MPADSPSWNRDPFKTGLILLLLLISAIGAPLLGLITIDACDMPWEGSYECFVPEPVFAYFMLSLLRPFFWFGSFALIWFALSISVLTGFVWMFASSALAALAGD